MKKTNHTLLLHPFFVACLLVLLLNDFFLKNNCHNWITGKLSDVAGIAVFAVFFTVLFPQKKQWVYAITVIVFVWFKSPLAQPAITFCNTALHLPVGRVVDYTDYCALLILPLAWHLKPFNTFSIYKRILGYISGTTAMFSFCATSMIAPRYLHEEQENYIDIGKEYKVYISEEDFLHRLDSLHITYKKDSVITEKVVMYSNDNLFFTRKDSTGDTLQMLTLPNMDKNYTRGVNLFHRFTTYPYIAITNFVIAGDTIPQIRMYWERYNGNKKTKHYIHLDGILFTDKFYRNHGWDEAREKMYLKVIKERIFDKVKYRYLPLGRMSIYS